MVPDPSKNYPYSPDNKRNIAHPERSIAQTADP
jgi:hypothetical protein